MISDVRMPEMDGVAGIIEKDISLAAEETLETLKTEAAAAVS